MNEQESEQVAHYICQCGQMNDVTAERCVKCGLRLSPLSWPRTATNNPQPPVVADVPERVWFYRLHNGTWMPTWSRTAPSDIEYVRAPTPDSITEKARRAARTLIYDDAYVVLSAKAHNKLLAEIIDHVAAIITTEFGGRVVSAGENKS